MDWWQKYKDRYRAVAERLGCSEELVEKAFGWQGWPSAIDPETGSVPSDLTKKNTWAELRDGELAKLEENLRQAHEAFNRLWFIDGNELAREVFVHTFTDDDRNNLVDRLEAVQQLQHFVRRARRLMPGKKGGPQVPDWERLVGWEVWEKVRDDKKGKKLYIDLMVELKAYEERVDSPEQLDYATRKETEDRARREWKKRKKPPRW